MKNGYYFVKNSFKMKERVLFLKELLRLLPSLSTYLEITLNYRPLSCVIWNILLFKVNWKKSLVISKIMKHGYNFLKNSVVYSLTVFSNSQSEYSLILLNYDKVSLGFRKDFLMRCFPPSQMFFQYPYFISHGHLVEFSIDIKMIDTLCIQ